MKAVVAGHDRGSGWTNLLSEPVPVPVFVSVDFRFCRIDRTSPIPDTRYLMAACGADGVHADERPGGMKCR